MLAGRLRKLLWNERVGGTALEAEGQGPANQGGTQLRRRVSTEVSRQVKGGICRLRY